MKKTMLFTLSLFLFTILNINGQDTDKKAIFQKLQGEWHTTQTTPEGQKIEFKWIFTPGFDENVIEFQSWRKQKDSDWAQNVQALYVYDSKSNALYAVGINSRGLAQRIVAQSTGENKIVFKYYEIQPDAPVRMESHWEIFEDRFESQTTVYQNGAATENEKITFYKSK